MKCFACPHALSEDVMVKCSLCNGTYHYDCVNIPFEVYKKNFRYENMDWHCPSCTNVTRRQKGDETPVRKHHEYSPQRNSTNMSICDDSPKEDQSRVDNSLCNSHNPMEASIQNFLCNSLSTMLDEKLGLVHKDLAAIHTKLMTTKQEIFLEIKKEVNSAIDKIKQEFSATTDCLERQISCFGADLSSLDIKVRELSSENSRLNAELLAMKNSCSEMQETSVLHETVEQLKLEINERDQALLLNDVEISGVPEHRSESTIHLVQTIALKLGLNFDDRDIVSANRVGLPRANGTESGRTRQDNRVSNSESALTSTHHDLTKNNSTGPRPRPLVVRFTRRALRDELLTSARSRRGLDSRDIGPPDHIPSKLFVNERLTKTNRIIFWQARQAANAANWRYVWTRDGRIYARRSDSSESKAVPIKTEKDVTRVFGVAPAAPSASK